MIQAFAPDRADEPFHERILSGAVRRRNDFLDLHALHSVPKLVAVDVVTIAQEIRRRGVVREGVHDLLGGPVGGGVLGHVEVDNPPAMVSEYDENEEHAQARGGHREEIEGDQARDMVGKERPPGLGRRRAPLWEQPGAPQSGLAAAIRMTRTLISAWTGGRPPVGRVESLVQYSRKRRRCHRRTVSGVTITRGRLHPAQTLASPTQKRRSVVRSLGRGAVLLYTASWWRKARFSRASWRWPPQRTGRSRSRWSKRVIIEPRFSPDQRRQINDLPPAEVLAKDTRLVIGRSLHTRSGSCRSNVR